MKARFIILISILSLTCEAKFGWGFSHYSILGGQQYAFHQQPLTGFDLQFDISRKSCTTHSNYKGFGVNYHFNQNQNWFGLKGLWGPNHLMYSTTRTRLMQPYLFLQANYIKIDSQNFDNYSLKPGIGFAGSSTQKRLLSYKTFFQVGYNYILNHPNGVKNSLMFEFKLGIAINVSASFKENQKEKT